MEESYLSSVNTRAFFSFSVLLDSFFQESSTLQKSFSKFWSLFQSRPGVGYSRPRPESAIQQVTSSTRVGHVGGSPGFLDREEVELVMGRLGLRCEEGGTRDVYGVDEISSIVEGKVSLEDAEGAFEVFDGNRDGFIDAEDLQRVLCRLGFKEGMEMGDCEKMIRAFDGNGDGKIDFQEFLMFMEN